MWSGAAANNEHDDDDVNDNGERVRLYQPMLYGRKPTQSNLASSFIGGQSTSSTVLSSPFKALSSLSTSSLIDANNSNSNNGSNIAKCTTCQVPLMQLVQLHVPKKSSNTGNESSGSGSTALKMDRTLVVSACNRASCVAGLFSNNDNNNNDGSTINVFTTAGGNGVIVCKRFMVVANEENSKQDTFKVTTAASAETAPVAANDNDWTVDDDMQGDTNTMDDLEAKLASMESSTTTTTNKTSSSKKQSNPKSEKSHEGEERATSGGTSISSFPCFELHSVQEPPARRAVMDEDDVGISASGASNDKIQQMLARYMQEEEDEDILALLRNEGHGGSGSGNGSSAAIAESDPGVSPEDRALLRFSDRLQRAPRQVLRYAYNGQPLWSVPLPSPNKNKKASRKQQGKKTRNDCGDDENENVIQVPPCNNCGAPRVFEAQILPSILHVLDVDRYAPPPPPTAADAAAATGDNMAYNNYYATAESGGMDFGNIAIYTCSAGCNGQDEFVVVQDSVDRLQQQQQQQQQLPMGRHHQAQEQRRMYSNNEVVVIPEDSKFDDNDEE